VALSVTACLPSEAEGVALGALHETDVDAAAQKALHSAHLPGLAACLVRDGAVAWCKGYGLADVATHRAVTPDTPFLLASVSKVFTATALMQRWEQGDFDLDDDVSRAALFPVRHPDSKQPITYRELLAHVAGVADSSEMERFYAYGHDPSISLEQVVRGYFVPGGAYYDPDNNFLEGPPGTAHAYSNMGFALLGYLAQRHAGEDLRAWSASSIFEPLGMKHTSWRLADFAHDPPAVPYRHTGNGFVSYGQYTFADYPNGGLRSSARSVARFLAAQANGGELDGHRILKRTTIERMLAVAYPRLDARQGLAWHHKSLGGDDWAGHTGGEAGVFTEMFMRPRDGTGFVLLTNGDVADPSLLSGLEKALVAFAETL
jgi:CubicO group peptidase (beta-lactamase class C family)